jgi:hypothetical protein
VYRGSRTLQVLLAGEPQNLLACSVDGAFALLGGRPIGVTIAGVARCTAVARWAPLAGVPAEAVYEAAAAEAGDAARRWAAGLPHDMVVRHRVAHSWPDVIRLARDHDMLIVAGYPRRRRQRRALVSAAWAAAIPVVGLATGQPGGLL